MTRIGAPDASAEMLPKHMLIDAFSVNNLSGKHVLVGHVRELEKALSHEWRFTVLTHRGNTEVADDMPASVTRTVAPVGAALLARAYWCTRHFDRYAREQQVDLVLSPAGMLSTGCSLPQIVLAQNPWPLITTGTGLEALRLWLQRRAFARAQSRAWCMVFNSKYMQALYQSAFGPAAHRTEVAHQGIADALFDSSHLTRDASSRDPTVLTVSVMARHKAIEVTVRAFASLASANADARLMLIGPWPDAGYRNEIIALVAELGLHSRVALLGHVHASELRQHYARARLFCLLSRCESFGIPAIEAQALGTPTVVADGTAAPEIAGPGGIVVPQDDVNAAAAAMGSLFDDDSRWAEYSARARRNAERFRWQPSSRPLVELIRSFGRAQGNC